MGGLVEHVGGEMYSQISCQSLAPGTAEQMDKKEKGRRYDKKMA